MRYGVPIFVSDKVMDEAAFIPENGDDVEKTTATGGETPPQEAGKPKLSKLEQLEHQLKEAVAKEDYERAAALRDELKRLKARDS